MLVVIAPQILRLPEQVNFCGIWNYVAEAGYQACGFGDLSLQEKKEKKEKYPYNTLILWNAF